MEEKAKGEGEGEEVVYKKSEYTRWCFDYGIPKEKCVVE